MQKMITLLAILFLSGCTTMVTTPPADCISFIPDSWKVAIPGTPLPVDDSQNEWVKFGLGQSGQLSKSNGRNADILHIFTVCENKANAARPRKKFLGIL